MKLSKKVARKHQLKQYTRKLIHNRKPHKKILVFGDSFTESFKILNMPHLILNTFHGSTMKGLTKPDNTNRIKIINLINKYSKHNNLYSVIFCFGHVDINESYFYNKIMNKPFDLTQIIIDYVKFINSIVDTEKYKVGIRLPYPDIVSDENIITNLAIYKVLDDYLNIEKTDDNIGYKEKQALKNLRLQKAKDAKEHIISILGNDLKLVNRISKIKKNNDLLKKEIAKYPKLICIDINKYLTDKNGFIRPEFIHPSVINHHILWEPEIPYLVKEMRIFGITDKFIKGDLNDMAQKFLAEKKLNGLS